jgi:hypothetical protein
LVGFFFGRLRHTDNINSNGGGDGDNNSGMQRGANKW